MGQDNPAWHSQSQTARETAAQEDEINFGIESAGVGAGATTELLTYDNTTSNRELLEMVTIAQGSNYTDTIRYTINIRDSGGTTIAEMFINPAHQPVTFDPAAPIPGNGSVTIDVENDSSSTVNITTSVLVRVVG